MKEYTILEALTDRLELITTANGYFTNAGSNVSQVRFYYSDSGDLPAIVVNANPDGDTVEGRSAYSTKYKLANEFIVEGHCSITTTLEPIYQLSRDIVRAVLSDDLRIDNKVMDIEYQGQKVTPSIDGNDIATVQVKFAVTYHEDLSQV